MIVEIDRRSWSGAAEPRDDRAVAALEAGAVLHFPWLSFKIEGNEERLFSVGLAGSAKNVSFTPASRRLGGTDASGDDAAVLLAALARFSGSAVALARAALPRYAGSLEVARASFRPAEIAGRRTSWRKDDTRLHVDSFPSAPTGGKRILRIFSNVNPAGRARRWRIGGPFADVVTRYRDRLRLPWPGEAMLLRALHLTKSRRTPYDALMLQLHDRMKQDDAFQSAATHTTIDFAAGTTWIAFTDEVSHAAMAGQYQFEQTLLLPVGGMMEPDRSPLRVLERTFRRTLA